MIPALRIDPYTHEVQAIEVPPNGCALKAALRRELDADAVGVAATFYAGDRLVVDPYKPLGNPHFLFPGVRAPIAGAGVLIGQSIKRRLTPHTLAAADILGGTIFMDSFDAVEWYASRRRVMRVIDISRFPLAA